MVNKGYTVTFSTSSVDMATGYGLDDQGFNTQWGLGIFHFNTMSRLALGPTQPRIQWVSEALSPGVKELRHETDHSPPSSAKVKEYMELYLHSTICLHGRMLS
jgi:hypothetical protein